MGFTALHPRYACFEPEPEPEPEPEEIQEKNALANDAMSNGTQGTVKFLK